MTYAMKQSWILSAALLASGPIDAATVGPGFSGVWNDPARSGEGYTLEILNETDASLAWFTFDGDGGPRWAYAIGNIVRTQSGDKIEFPDIYRSVGGTFDSSGATHAVVPERVGSASMDFTSCNSGTFSFDAFGQSMSVPIERLVRVMGANCSPVHGQMGDVVRPYAGQSGMWYDPDRLGHGYQLQWTSDNAAILGWYTFDSQGNPYWLTGLGRIDGNPALDGSSRVVFETVNAVRGPRFGAHFNPDDIEITNWGRVVLELGCERGTVQFNSPLLGFGSGTRTIALLTRATQSACPWEAPSIGDLYNLEYVELPIPPAEIVDGRLVEHPIQAVSIADDGTVLARESQSRGGSKVLLLRPGAGNWLTLAESGHGQGFLISPDAVRVYSSTEATAPGSSSPALLWRASEGWSELPLRLGYEREVHQGVSQDGTQLVGRGSYPSEVRDHAWKWNAGSGQTQLATSEQIPGGSPTAISNDGKTVVGFTIRNLGGRASPVAVRWFEAESPTVLRDAAGNELGLARACDATCGTVFGYGWVNQDLDTAESMQVWYWRSPFNVGYLGRLDDAIPGTTFGVADVSADGSLAVGNYLSTAAAPAATSEGWIWTPQTGLVSLQEVLQETDLADDWTIRYITSLSSDGLTILMTGAVDHPPQLMTFRAAVLRLTPK